VINLNDDIQQSLPDFDPEQVISSEVIEHTEATNDRSIARRIALQVLYEVDSADHLVSEVMDLQTNYHRPSSQAEKYMRGMVVGVISKHRLIDRVIKTYAPEWPLAQVALVDRNILRIAVYEIGVGDRVPTSAAINEAVELAKLYGADGSSRFVNGVLGTITQNLSAIRAELAVEQNTDDVSAEGD